MLGLIWVCKVLGTISVRISDDTENTPVTQMSAEGCFGNFKVFSQSSGALSAKDRGGFCSSTIHLT